MNIYLKYAPLIYTFSRDGGLKTLPGFFMTNITLPLLVSIYLYLIHYVSLLEGVKVFGYFLAIFIVFYLWYEIGYLYNDIYTMIFIQ